MAKSVDIFRRGHRAGRWRVRLFPLEVLPGVLACFQIGLALVLSAAIGTAVGAFVSVVRSLPSDPNLAEFAPKAATAIFSWQGELLGKVWTEKREPVPISEIPRELQLAVVATEDKRFFHHHGVDFQGILRAAKANITQGRVVEGASTITQQLARDLYLTRKRTITRKLQEAILAVEIERRFSKVEILELYLNQVNFGHAAYGVNCAAHLYFGKDLKDLTLGECALLAGLPRRPAYYSPYDNPEIARQRRDSVLRKMWERGYITEGQFRRAAKEQIRLAGEKPRLWEQLQAPYFTSYVVQQLVKRYGEKRVYEGGLRVFTTLQVPLQRAAEKAIQEHASQLKRLRASQTALVAIHPQTGYIVAMVGGLDYAQSEFNRATQAQRQPGSSFKPFVYATAIGQGMSPYSSINAQARSIQGWVCENYDERNYGNVTFIYALGRSVNTAAVNLQQRVGTENVIRTAKAMGIKSPLLPVPSLAIGTNEVTLLEMTSALGTFPADGIHYEPMAVVRVEDYRGMVVDAFSPQPKRALTTKTAQMMTKMLQWVVRSGTGRRVLGVHPEAAGKTGTTDEFRDAWFIGFVPDLAVGVWAGNDDRSPTAGMVGGTGCAPTWRSFVLEARKHFERPPTVATALAEEEAVKYDLSKRKPDKSAKKPQAPPTPSKAAATDEPPPRKASTAPTKAKAEPSTVEGFVRPGPGDQKGEAAQPSGPNPPGFGLSRGREPSASHSSRESTKAAD